jgi:hypothetical protein
VALSEAKLANAEPDRIVQAAEQILDEIRHPALVPLGDFWRLAYDPENLVMLCRLREGLLSNCISDERKALRGILLGALHGPRGKLEQSYFSNQCPRTFAPKPDYAIKFWKRHQLAPSKVDILKIVRRRADRYYKAENMAIGRVIHADSRNADVFNKLVEDIQVDWVITSPPYFGMDTYVQDQWLRLWFLGGSSQVDYSTAKSQLRHTNQFDFARQLSLVWQNVSILAKPTTKLVIRFGSINHRRVDAIWIIKNSLRDTGWRITTIKDAGNASAGRRQAEQFSLDASTPKREYDVWARWDG